MAHNSWRLRLVHSTSTELTSISIYFTRDTLLARYLLLSVRPSVRPSQAGIVSKRLDKSSWLLARRFPATIPHCVIKKFGYLQKLRVLFCGTLSQTPDLDNFARANRSRCQQNSSMSSLTVEFVDDNYMTIDESWLFTTGQSTVTLSLHNCDLLWICCTTCFYSRQDFD